jgi:hypothetical protein
VPWKQSLDDAATTVGVHCVVDQRRIQHHKLNIGAITQTKPASGTKRRSTNFSTWGTAIMHHDRATGPKQGES